MEDRSRQVGGIISFICGECGAVFQDPDECVLHAVVREHLIEHVEEPNEESDGMPSV